MSRPEVTITEKQIVVLTEAFRLHVEFTQGAERRERSAPPPAPHEGGETASAPAAIPKAKKVKYGIKNCKSCWRDYTPTGPAQQYCEDCKPKKSNKSKKRLEELDGEELDKTLEEIENRRKRPYKFTK